MTELDVVEPDLFGEIHPKPPAPPAPAVPAVVRPGPPVQLEAFRAEVDQYPGQGTFVDATGTDARLDVVLFAPPATVPCEDCGRPLRAAASRRRGRGPDCDEKRRARRAADQTDAGTLL